MKIWRAAKGLVSGDAEPQKKRDRWHVELGLALTIAVDYKKKQHKHIYEADLGVVC